MSDAHDFGVQSYCFREFKDNRQIAKWVREIGLNKIEICGIHADFDDLTRWREVVDIYGSEGVSIVSIGVQTFQGADRERNWFECAAVAGAGHLSAHLTVGSYLQAIPKLQAWSREYGVRVGLHCHGGYMFGGSPDVVEHLITLGGPEIGLCLDTAWAMQIGPHQGNPVEWVKRFGSHLYGLHYKDFTFARNGQWQDVIVGEGNLDLVALMDALAQVQFDGAAVIEYEADPSCPLPALKRCVESMRRQAGTAGARVASAG